MKIVIFLLVCASFAAAQEAHKIPFASQGNMIELSVANNSELTAEELRVEVADVPQGLKFEDTLITISKLRPGKEQTASFTFSVDKKAQVDRDHTLTFTVTTKTGGIWKKEIKINILAPAKYELFQNYPNPFNPTTIISYQLSAASKVNLIVYDMLGREVMKLVDKEQDAGYQEAMFDAQNYASGVYFYRLLATDRQKNKHIFQNRMVLLK